MDELDKTVPELDRLMVRVLELMEELIKSKAKIEEVIKDGCLDLAKTRYIIGNHNVSSLQLPTEDSEEIKALATVLSSEGASDKAHHTIFQLRTENPSKITNSVKSRDTDVDSLRQRIKYVLNKNEDDKDCEFQSEDDSNSKHKTGEQKQHSDPLRWFGVLVPQNLKKAQRSFQRALKLAVECTNIQNELKVTQERFNVLYNAKQSLLLKKS